MTRPILYPNEKDDKEDIVCYQEIIEECQPVLDNPGISYEEALKILPEEIVDCWKQGLMNQFTDKRFKRHKETIISLKTFLKERVIHHAASNMNIIQAKKQIREQAINLSYAPSKKMETLQRYETAMDRAFERKLAMLLKLQEIRNNKDVILQG